MKAALAYPNGLRSSPEYGRARRTRSEAGLTTVQGKLHAATDSKQYREGTVKSTPARGVKQTLKSCASMPWEGLMCLTACLLEYDPASSPSWPG